MRKSNIIIFALFLLVAVAVVGGQYVFGRSKGTFLNPVSPTGINVLYSSELSEWIVPAADAFNAAKHKIGDSELHVDLQKMEDGDVLRGIASGTLTPTVWIPASTTWVNLLNNTWRGNHQTDIILRSGEYGTTPLALTPMVFVMYKERADAFTKKFGGTVDWKEIEEAITTAGGWQALGGDPDWGTVKYGQTNPSTSNAGLLAVTLATYTYQNKTTGLTTADLQKSDYLKWIQGLANGLVADAPATAEGQMDDLLRYGPSRYDVISIYENLVAQKIKSHPELQVFYPRINIWSDHPFSILASDWTSAEQKDAALVLEKYLYSPAVQSQALKVGFRPANPDVVVTSSDPENPFNKYKGQGLQARIPRQVLADAPPGDVLYLLQRVFTR